MDRETLIRAILECNFAGFNSDIIDVAVKRIMECTGDEPIKHGHWVRVVDNRGVHFECPYCGEWEYHQGQKYCGECGAKMDEEG